MDWRQHLHRAARKADRAVCWGIGVETLGGLLYDAIRAKAFFAVTLLLLLAAVCCWRGIHRRRRRIPRTRPGHTHPNRTGGPT